MTKYTQGIMVDGPVILCEGRPLTPEQIVARLNWCESGLKRVKLMKTIEIGTQRFSIVQVEDEPGAGGACHEYYISPADGPKDAVAGEFGHVRFQRGPVGEKGVNGCFQEDLLAIVIHRLQGFQSGEFRCRENALALTKMEEALHWLNARTAGRQKRGVEGTSRK